MFESYLKVRGDENGDEPATALAVPPNFSGRSTVYDVLMAHMARDGGAPLKRYTTRPSDLDGEDYTNAALAARRVHRKIDGDDEEPVGNLPGLPYWWDRIEAEIKSGLSTLEVQGGAIEQGVILRINRVLASLVGPGKIEAAIQQLVKLKAQFAVCVEESEDL